MAARLLEGLHGLLEVALAVVVAGEHLVPERVVRPQLDGLLERGFGLVIAALVLVELAEAW